MALFRRRRLAQHLPKPLPADAAAGNGAPDDSPADANSADASPADANSTQASEPDDSAPDDSAPDTNHEDTSTPSSNHADTSTPDDSPADDSAPAASTPPRAAILKTYKLFLGGNFPRSESGRTYPVHSAQGDLLAHAVRASRKDVREAVKSARSAQQSWSSRTAYNRGQILYRIAEMMESRRQEFVRELMALGEVEPRQAYSIDLAQQSTLEVDTTIERWIWYAGWCDKFGSVSGSSNPVAGPYFGFTIPEATGVAGIVAPDEAPLLGLVSRLAPALVSGNTAVAVASQRYPLPAIILAEALATSDVPPGVVNILTGLREELVPPLAGHADVNAVDMTGCEPDLRTQAQTLAAQNVMRVVCASERESDWLAATAQSPYLIESFCEYKTVWHPKGA